MQKKENASLKEALADRSAPWDLVGSLIWVYASVTCTLLEIGSSCLVGYMKVEITVGVALPWKLRFSYL